MMDRVNELGNLFCYRSLTDQQRQCYEQEGYCLYGRSLTDLGLKQMRTGVMAAWTSQKGPFDPNENWLKNALLTDVHKLSDVARQFYFSGPLVDVSTEVIGPNIKAATSQLTFKMRGNTQSFAWHQDNGYGELEPYNAISCLTALDDSDEANGCIWLIPGSHQGRQISIDRDDEAKARGEEIRLDVDETKAIPMSLPAGHSLFFNCWMLHKSEGNFSKDRDRRILFVRYADADAVEVYNKGRPRLGRLLRGRTRFPEVEAFEADLSLR